MNIDVKHLSMKYGTSVAIDQLSFSFHTGMLGVLGPNGAGKTTLLNILATLLPPTSGQVIIGGFDIRTQKQNIRPLLGFLPQEFGLYENLTAYEFLDYMSVLKGLWSRDKEIYRVLQMVGLEKEARQKIKTFSGGMRQRVGIAQAILHSPPLLIVDEPTVGLDPEERNRFRQLLTQLAIDSTVILSTHLIEDIAHATNRIIVLGHGKLLFDSTVTQLLNIADGKVWETTLLNKELDDFKRKHKILNMIIDGEKFVVRFFSETGDGLNAVSVTPNLEEAYLSIFKQDKK